MKYWKKVFIFAPVFCPPERSIQYPSTQFTHGDNQKTIIAKNPDLKFGKHNSPSPIRV